VSYKHNFCWGRNTSNINLSLQELAVKPQGKTGKADSPDCFTASTLRH